MARPNSQQMEIVQGEGLGPRAASCTPNQSPGREIEDMHGVIRITKDTKSFQLQLVTTVHYGINWIGVNSDGRCGKPLTDSLLLSFRNLTGRWITQHRNMAGCSTLITSILNDLPLHTWQSFLTPLGVLQRIDKLRRGFFWNHDTDSWKMHHFNWQTTTTSKNLGGLGLKNLQCFNIALLSKTS